MSFDAYLDIMPSDRTPAQLRDHSMVRQAETLTKLWMQGDREGSPGGQARRAWEHPQDLVELLMERPGDFSEAGQIKAMAVAWLHDVIEDGKTEKGRRVTASDFEPYVVPYLDENLPAPPDAHLTPEIVKWVEQLTHKEEHSKIDYLATLKDIDYIPKLVKCVDRICNLREGKATFTDARWARVVEETQLYVLPLAQDLREETAEWLTRNLLDAIAARSL